MIIYNQGAPHLHTLSRSTSGANQQSSDAGTISADGVKEHLFCSCSHEQPRPAPVLTRTTPSRRGRPRRSGRTTGAPSVHGRGQGRSAAPRDKISTDRRRAQNNAPAPDNYQRAPHDSNRPRYLPAPTNVSTPKIIHAPRQLERPRKYQLANNTALS